METAKVPRLRCCKLGQVFKAELVRSATSPPPARLPLSQRAACERCGIAAVVDLRWDHSASRCQRPRKQPPPKRALGGPSLISAFEERAWWAQGKAALPQRVLRLPLCSAHDKLLGSVARSRSRAHLCERSAYLHDRADELHPIHVCAVASCDVHASAVVCAGLDRGCSEASRRVSGPVDSRAC